ncbi:hypothetical protein [Microbacterium suwonense]|uniref:Uncharacterized protein n=1 Tax=Microbacterium suwonense TaxID=683047 RepID=A0ABM8FTA6_9MICO|nr:hypothetical protein [Microbacterium suwonense]BDZ38777.1 hypothetical protein GCM10025863_13910 [Microbacterium suwonense]
MSHQPSRFDAESSWADVAVVACVQGVLWTEHALLDEEPAIWPEVGQRSILDRDSRLRDSCYGESDRKRAEDKVAQNASF